MVCNGICDDYFEKLSEILKSLKKSEIFLSLSGKEPTEGLSFVEKVYKLIYYPNGKLCLDWNMNNDFFEKNDIKIFKKDVLIRLLEKSEKEKNKEQARKLSLI